MLGEQALQERIDILNGMIEKKDVFGLMFRLRSGLNRYDFGLLDDHHYSVAYGGTKNILNVSTLD